jgi:hypothetical protein
MMSNGDDSRAKIGMYYQDVVYCCCCEIMMLIDTH